MSSNLQPIYVNINFSEKSTTALKLAMDMLLCDSSEKLNSGKN